MNRSITAVLGGTATLALAAAPLTASATDYHGDKGHDYTPKPYIKIVDTDAKVVKKIVIIKYVNKHGKVKKVVVKKETKSEAEVKVAYKCFTKDEDGKKGTQEDSKYGWIKVQLDHFYGGAKADCDGEKHYAKIVLHGKGDLKPGYRWVKATIKDPQGEKAYDADKAKVEHVVYKKVVIKKQYDHDHKH